ncbi:MAG: CooT family nickel-binding protein [Candidatus Bipolaricaulia bacterium]
MCLSKAFVETEGDKKLLVKDVSSVEVDNGKLLFTTVLGEEQVIKGTIQSIDFRNNELLLEKTEEAK